MKKINIQKTIFSDFNQRITGSYGIFKSRSGNVNYLQVTARIGLSGTDLESQLASQLVPVREILDPKTMNFGQLLQRDLDDHRVSTKLVPYILENSNIGPSYFPPIQAILLPFEVSDDTLLPEPRDSFGSLIEPPIRQNDEGLFWKGYQHEESYKFEKLTYSDGTPLNISHGQLSWHDKKSRLVVLDGQHRAMAMLALYRTIHKAWKGTGSQYRHFYEDKINDLIHSDPKIKEKITNGIEYPVTIMWFDDETKHHNAARKLFVDVNKNAKPPTRSRLILLSETDLIDIFSRNILDKLREKNDQCPIYAIEYDYTKGVNNTQTSRWGSLINIEMLNATIKHALMGPSKLVLDLTQKPSPGRDKKSELSQRLREQLLLDQWFPSEYKNSDHKIYHRNKISSEEFPIEEIKNFNEKFESSWGESIIYILSNFLPFKAHIATLNNLKSDWSDHIDNESALAREAIFDGVGLYWTIKDAYDEWKENEGKSKGTPDIISAWNIMESKRQTFKINRYKKYLPNEKQDLITECDDFYNKTSSYANLIGLTMTIASIAKNQNITGSSILDLTKRCITTINTWLDGDSKKGTRRKLFLTNHLKNESFNQINKLDQPYWIYFRYYWFEVLNNSLEETCSLSDSERSYIELNIKKLRNFYFDTIIKPEQKKAIEKVSDKVGKELEAEIETAALKKFNKCLNTWFNCEYTIDNTRVS